MFDNELKSLTDFSNNSEKFLNKNLDELTKYIKHKNKSLSWLLPLIKTIKSNSNFILGLFFVLSLYYSNYFIIMFYNFLLIDSIVLSVLIMQNELVKFNSRRLAKNVISMFILNFNFFGSLISVIMVFAIYFGFNKFINKIIFKLIEIIINFLSTALPFVKDLYPSIKLIDHNKTIESTEAISSTGTDDSDNSDNSGDSESDSSISKIKNLSKKNILKENKLFSKIITKYKDY